MEGWTSFTISLQLVTIVNSYCHNNVTKETGEKKKITLWDGNSMAALNPPEVNYNDILTDDG